MVEVPMTVLGHAVQPKENIVRGDASEGVLVRLNMVTPDDSGRSAEKPRVERDERRRGGVVGTQRLAPAHRLHFMFNNLHNSNNNMSASIHHRFSIMCKCLCVYLSVCTERHTQKDLHNTENTFFVRLII